MQRAVKQDILHIQNCFAGFRVSVFSLEIIYRGYWSAMSCKILWKQPFGCGSPYQRHHMNSCKYSCRKLLFVFPFIFFSFSFAALQLLSAFCVWTPVAGSTKLIEWLTVWWFKPRSLWILLYAAHWSEWTIVPGRSFRRIIGKSVAAFRLLTSCRYGREGWYCVSKRPSTHLSLLVRRPLWYCHEKWRLK